MDIVGLDIGGTKCTVVHADESGEIDDSLRFETTGFEETYAKLLAAAGETAACRIVPGELGDRISEVAPVAVALYRMEADQ